MGYWCVLRSDRETDRPENRFEFDYKLSDRTWSVCWYDLDHNVGARGFVEVFNREDAARTAFEQLKDFVGEETSVYLLWSDAWFKERAARAAANYQCLDKQAKKQAELIDHHVAASA